MVLKEENLLPALLLGQGLGPPRTLRRSHQQAAPTLDCSHRPEEELPTLLIPRQC